MATTKAPGSAPPGEQPMESATQVLERLHKSVDDFLKYRDIFADAAVLKTNLSQRDAEIEEKDKKIGELESAITLFNHGGNKEITRLKLENMELKKEKADLCKDLKQTNERKTRTEEEVEKLKQQLAKERGESTQTRRKLDAMERTNNANKDLAQRLEAANSRLKAYDKYTVNLLTPDTGKISTSLDKLWKRTETVVTKYFSVDIQDDLLENQRKWTQEACKILEIESPLIVIPHTNSPAAKFVRRVVMLSVFAHIYTKYIFTVTPSRLSQAGLDELLFKLLVQDKTKEQLLRAIILSESSQGQIPADNCHELAADITNALGVILPSKSRAAMEASVKELLDDAVKCWIEPRRSRDKIIATIDVPSYPSCWTDYPNIHRNKQLGKRTQSASSGDEDEDEDEEGLPVFPALLMISGNKPILIRRGALVHASQLREAEKEGKELKKRRFSRSGPLMAILGKS